VIRPRRTQGDAMNSRSNEKSQMNPASSEPVLPTPTVESSVNTKPPFTGCHLVVKWTARVLSLPIILFISISLGGAVLTGDYGGTGEMIVFLSALVIFLVAWRWELVGGGLLVMGISIMWWITRTPEHTREEPWAAYILCMLGFLFLTSGSLRIAVNPAASQKAVKTARILALLFAVLMLACLGGCFATGAAHKFNG